jgi:hypothetical protein
MAVSLCVCLSVYVLGGSVCKLPRAPKATRSDLRVAIFDRVVKSMLEGPPETEREFLKYLEAGANHFYPKDRRTSAPLGSTDTPVMVPKLKADIALLKLPELKKLFKQLQKQYPKQANGAPGKIADFQRALELILFD